MADNLEDIKLTKQELENAAQYIKEMAALKGVKEGELKLSKETIRTMAKEIASGQYKADKELAKNIKSALQDAIKEQKQVIQEQTKKNEGFLSRIGFVEKQGDDQFKQVYRARQIAGGFETIAGGQIGSGIRQIMSAFPKVANFMTGPYYLAIQTVITGLSRFDEALSKSTKMMTSATGGLQSEYVGNRFKAFGARHNLKESLREIGLQGNLEDIMQSISSSYGIAYSKNNLQNLVKTTGYAQQGLGSLGISAQSSQGLISNLQLIEGKDQQSVYAALQRLTNRFQTMSMFSPEQALQQATSLYDQTKHLGTNFEWASRTIQKFEVGLKNGTLALSDFAAVNRSLRSGQLSKNAGIAAMVSDYAFRSGISLPSSFINSNAIGQGFAISTRAMLSNNQFARAYQGQLQEQLEQMGMTTRQEKAGALQLLLQERGINISPEAAENAIRKDGSLNLIGAGIIGSQAFEKEKAEQKQAEDYQKLVQDYYKGTASYQDLMKRWMGGIYNKYVGNSVSTGISEGMSTDSTDFIRNFTAVFTHPIDNLSQFVENTKYVLDKLSGDGVSVNIKSPNQ